MALAPRRRIASRRWRPLGVQKPPLRRGDGDDRVEEVVCLGDDVGEPLVVRVREVALKRRGLDAIDRKDREDQAVPAQRLAVRADGGAPFGLDCAVSSPIDVATSGPTHALASRPVEAALALRGVRRRVAFPLPSPGASSRFFFCTQQPICSRRDNPVYEALPQRPAQGDARHVGLGNPHVVEAPDRAEVVEQFETD